MGRSEWVLVPRKLTAENGAKAALLGEFSVRDSLPCPYCDTPDDDCEHCEGTGRVAYEIAVPWDTIKRIHEAVVDLFPPPPAEQASGELLRSLADRWEQRAAECEKDAERLGMQPVANELARDAAQYRQCAYQLRGALAPQQPEKGEG